MFTPPKHLSIPPQFQIPRNNPACLGCQLLTRDIRQGDDLSRISGDRDSRLRDEEIES